MIDPFAQPKSAEERLRQIQEKLAKYEAVTDALIAQHMLLVANLDLQIAKLKVALLKACEEIDLHNDDYTHQTPQTAVQEWKEMCK